MDSIYAIIKAIRPVFLNFNSSRLWNCRIRLFRRKSGLNFKLYLDKAIPKQQFRIHGLCDTLLIPP
ncbi:hypothetical protein [Daejeonella sp.]|uniref:hypothetical protein n=1 Tax=Daejeonella sp. TaxID=2805397 RepID=UPI0037BEC5B4